MHRMNRHARMASLLLALALLAVPALGAAQIGLVAPVEVGDTIPEFGNVRSCLGVSASNKWLRQARVGGLPLELRAYNPDGDTLQFQEDLGRLDEHTDALRLSMRVRGARDSVTIQIDQSAMNVLERVEIEEIVLVNEDYVVLARYTRRDIQALRDALSLREGEQICLSGEDQPVTVVSEDGVRRMITM